MTGALLFDTGKNLKGSKKSPLYGGGRIGIYPGQYYDEETGIHYNYFRDYHPGIGRYLTPDPSHYPHAEKGIFPYLLPYLIVIPQEFNPYIFVLNNPINLLDFHGLSTLCKIKCYAVKFLDVHHCNITWHIEYHECLKLFKINPKECIEQAKKRRDRCIQRAEERFNRCMKKCEKEENCNTSH